MIVWKARSLDAIYTAAACALLSAVFALNVFRAYNQSITYDEAYTYNHYVPGPFGDLISDVANNHAINSLACRVTTGMFGVSEITLRMPSLAGGLLYFIFIFLICRRVFDSGPFLLLAVAILMLNPFVLDYLSAARGYGLGLGFLMVGMHQLYMYLDDPAGGVATAKGKKRLKWAAVCLALAVHSNLTFLIGAGALVLAFLAIAIRHGREKLDSKAHSELLHSLYVDFVRPGLIVFGALAITLVKLRPKAFYIGETSIRASLKGMVAAALNHSHTTWPWDNESPAFAVFAEFAATFGVIAVALTIACVCAAIATKWLRDRRGLDALLRHERFVLLCGGTFLLSCALIVLLHFAVGMKYPYERTGLYLAPLFFLASLTVLYNTLRQKTARLLLGIPALTLTAALIVQFAVQLPETNYYREWRFDSTSRDVFQAIIERADRSGGRPIRVGSHWRYTQSLLFYCASRQTPWVEVEKLHRSICCGENLQLPLTQAEELVHNSGPFDFYVYFDGKRPLTDQKLTPIFRSDKTDVAVAIADGERNRTIALAPAKTTKK